MHFLNHTYMLINAPILNCALIENSAFQEWDIPTNSIISQLLLSQDYKIVSD